MSVEATRSVHQEEDQEVREVNEQRSLHELPSLILEPRLVPALLLGRDEVVLIVGGWLFEKLIFHKPQLSRHNKHEEIGKEEEEEIQEHSLDNEVLIFLEVLLGLVYVTGRLRDRKQVIAPVLRAFLVHLLGVARASLVHVSFLVKLVFFVHAMLRRRTEGVVDAFLKYFLLLEEHVRVNAEGQLSYDHQRNDEQLQVDHCQNRLILLAAVPRLHVVSCNRAMVLKVICHIIILENVWFEVFLENSIH